MSYRCAFFLKQNYFFLHIHIVNIVKNTTEKYALTLTEKSLYATSEWIIKLTNDMNGELGQRVFAINDISNFERSNIFYVTESTTEDLYNATVCLSPSGQWTYTVYEMAPSSPRNLNPNDALKIVETGRCLVFDNPESEPTVFIEDENKNNVTFDEP